MKGIHCKINYIDSGKTQKGRLFDQPEEWGFDQLIAWVYRNCKPAEIKIIPEQEVLAIFEDRMETYYFGAPDYVKNKKNNK